MKHGARPQDSAAKQALEKVACGDLSGRKAPERALGEVSELDLMGGSRLARPNAGFVAARGAVWDGH